MAQARGFGVLFARQQVEDEGWPHNGQHHINGEMRAWKRSHWNLPNGPFVFPERMVPLRGRLEPPAPQTLCLWGPSISAFRQRGVQVQQGLVHWIAAQENADAKTDVNAAVAGVHAWNERKKKIMHADHIRSAWQRLREQGWI